MARDRAKINTGIWGDSDWKSLTMPQQWLYTTMLTRPELNHVGVGDWRPRRVSSLATGITVADVEDAATALQQQRFILIDEDTEEVLIRSFLKHDGVLDNPNLGASIKGAYDAIYSTMLQQVVVHELHKIIDRTPVSVMKSEKSRKHIEALLELPATPIDEHLNAVQNAVPKGDHRTPSTTPLGTSSPTAFQKGDPSTTTTATTTSLSNESEYMRDGIAQCDAEDYALIAPEDAGPSLADKFEQFYAAYPRKRDRAKAKEAFEKAVKQKKVDADRIITAAQSMADDPNLPEARLVPHAATWLNGERWNDPPYEPRTTGGPPQQFQSSSERRYAQGMSLVEDELREFYNQPQEIEQ